MLKRVFTAIILLICTGAVTASDDSPISVLTGDTLIEIIASTYADYDDPIEFTYVATVSKTWHAAIKSPLFMEKCRARGFVEPVMMFYTLEITEKEKSPDILTQDLTEATAPRYYDKAFYFFYFDPTTIKIDASIKGLFWRKLTITAIPFLAIWVNPKKVAVYDPNVSLSWPIDLKISLAQHIMLYERVKKMGQSPNDMAAMHIKPPISAQRFVKKWPSTFKFKKQE